jgi:SAM-dependent methyltransferase
LRAAILANRTDPEVTLDDAIELLRPAIDPAASTWADLGAGVGTFTEALASILDRDSRILAVDSDRDAIAALETVADRTPPHGRIVVAMGDIEKPHDIATLVAMAPDGVLLSNVLHYLRNPAIALRSIGEIIRPDGRIVIIEYDRESGNRWVPYPLAPERLAGIAAMAGLSDPRVVARRPSRYQGDMYCAVLFVRKSE